MSEEPLRASDAERESAVHALAAHYADGRLDRTEFDERVDTALAARTRPQLEALFADLPDPSSAAVVALSEAAADAGAESASPDHAARRPAARRRGPAVGLPVLLLAPVLVGLAVTAAVHGLPLFPLIPLFFFILSRRGRRWNREARPW